MVFEDEPVVTVGVLALQGAFHEHINHLARVPSVRAIAVRSPEQLALCSALVIPGGESTAIALGAERSGLLEPLRQWVRTGKPTWGTCAGMIMLAREAVGGKKQQELIGGWDGRVSRNGWGSQVDSFEIGLDISVLAKSSSSSSSSRSPAPFPGVFIRAPVVERLLPVEELAHTANDQPAQLGLRQGEELAGIELVQKSDTVASDGKRPTALPLPGPSDLVSSTSLPVNALRLAIAPPLNVAPQDRPPVEVIARLGPEVRPTNSLPGPDADVVALRQANVFVTTFHPELTTDRRLHEWWIKECVRKSR